MLTSKDVLSRFELCPNVYLVGSYERGVTIHSQQVRALNLAWAMVEELSTDQLSNMAVIGGGFAGLTFAAGLLKKGIQRLTIFEKRSVFCPLQQGSDTRWVHPHIYDWPAEESELPTAALPVLTWTAGRASDIAVQVLKAWEELKVNCRGQVTEIRDAKYMRIEASGMVDWISSHRGDTKAFSSLILALGFGEERDSDSSATVSYWRNESFGHRLRRRCAN